MNALSMAPYDTVITPGQSLLLKKCMYLWASYNITGAYFFISHYLGIPCAYLQKP